MSTDFGRKKNKSTLTKPSITIGIIISQITSLEIGTGIERNSNVRRNSSDGTPPRNARIFGLFYRGTLDLSDRSAS